MPTDAHIGDFLRSRRARLLPGDVGLPEHGRRRVPGLRREEVAQLAGVSVDYYVRLEQGRGPSVSDAVLDAIARVLRLDGAEREYLYALARPARRGGVPPGAEEVRPGLRLLLDGMAGTPAFVLGRRMDVLAWNAAGDAVMGFSGMGPGTPDIPRHCFLDPASRVLYPEWPLVAAECVAFLRLAAGRHPQDGRLAALVDELAVLSEDFRRLWADQGVTEKTFGVKRLRHATAGDLTFAYETLRAPADEDQLLVVYTPEPGTGTAERLGALTVRTPAAAERLA
ncbi:helix-turn-helix transcriptional regulator [Streptomyces avicenniae]|uniref:helix-turn-helix transcriptional regulator n=1 Tax=Streptomyces avicenniae TaxID=500153 RepID=UPI00069BFB84|nr:helix-turn-helix transcriptional regulator [Streptomyces avicenniae]